MKKYLYLTVVMFGIAGFINNVNANEVNNIEKSQIYTQEKAGHKMFKGMHKNHNKDKMHKRTKHHKDKQKEKMTHTYTYSNPIMQCKIEDLNGEYQDILSQIASSSMTQDARKLLSIQAAEVYNLAQKQLKERMDLKAKQACERMPYKCELFTNKQNRKILRDINKLFY